MQTEYLGLNLYLNLTKWNITDPQELKRIWHTMLPPLQALAKALALSIRVLDLGGGLGIPYAGQTESLSWAAVQEVLADIQAHLPDNEIWMELGRYVVGEVGYYVVPVVDCKTSGGKALLVLAGGVNHLLRPEITGQAFPASMLRESPMSKMPFQLHGPLCTRMDGLGTHDLPSDISVGDCLIFFQCGAYGFTESMPLFLCHTLPGEVVYQSGKTEIIRMPAAAATWLK